MSDEGMWKAVDSYLSETLVGPDAALAACLEASAAAGLPAISVSPVQGKLLMLAARAVQARRILEVGTLGGYSTIWLARGLADRDALGRKLESKGFGREGRIVTLEANADYAAAARANLERAGVADCVELRVGRAAETLPQIAAETPELFPFDLVFIDADKASTPVYLEWAVKLSRPGTIIVIDNVVRDGEIVNGESADEAVVGMRRALEMLGSGMDGRVVGTALQTVGSKGYDGFAVAAIVG